MCRCWQAGFVIAWLALSLTSCTGPQSEVSLTERAGYSPNYWSGCLSNSWVLAPKVSQKAMRALSCRSECDDYWRLLSILVSHAPDIRYLVLMEQLPEGELDEYRTLLVFRTTNRAYCYANSILWLAAIGEANAGDVRDAREKGPAGQIPVAEADELFEAIEKQAVCSYESSVLAPGGDVPAIGKGALAVHLYRTKDRASRDWITEGLMYDRSVVLGEARVDQVARSRDEPADTELPGERWEQLPPGQKKIWERHYRETYPVRLIASGALRILRSARAKPADGRPEANARAAASPGDDAATESSARRPPGKG
ncbi:MAG: hypothetical protein BWX88_04427 [Planctomycetes bacterium ADurb.Bin126]|nr:MAG: hypothetical protein BWX88_04427 [Planctomycetes bacterium ADurb.Bin126]HOD82860.1 hypothetical protein [Phycisphaerae bacterium]